MTSIGPLYTLRSITFFLQFRECNHLLLPVRRLPSRQRIGQEHLRSLPSALVLGEWRVQPLHRNPDLKMRDHEGRGHDFEAEHALYCRLFHPSADERPESLAFEIRSDAAQDFRQIGPGAAARVEDVDVLRCESICDAEVVLQCLVHPRDHVANDLARCVPDAKLLAQIGIERFQKWLVEIGDCIALGEAGEEGCAVHPVQRGGGPVQHLH